MYVAYWIALALFVVGLIGSAVAYFRYGGQEWQLGFAYGIGCMAVGVGMAIVAVIIQFLGYAGLAVILGLCGVAMVGYAWFGKFSTEDYEPLLWMIGGAVLVVIGLCIALASRLAHAYGWI